MKIFLWYLSFIHWSFLIVLWSFFLLSLLLSPDVNRPLHILLPDRCLHHFPLFIFKHCVCINFYLISVGAEIQLQIVVHPRHILQHNEALNCLWWKVVDFRIFNDHVSSMKGGNVFTGVCDYVQGGKEGMSCPGPAWGGDTFFPGIAKERRREATLIRGLAWERRESII